MKGRGKYLVTTILILFIGYIGFISISKNMKTEYIAKGNKANIVMEQWMGLIADSVNEKKIQLYLDGKNILFSENRLYMDEYLNIMIPVNEIMDVFDCTINIYNNQKILIEKASMEMTLSINSSQMIVNGNEFSIKGKPLVKDSIMYVPMGAIVDGLGYDYSWNSMENAGYLIGNKDFLNHLPEYYNYVDKNKNGVVKNQGYLGTCWACAALTALETTVRPEMDCEFSVDHMTLNNSFNLTQYDGGEYSMAMAYLTAWQGPVYEKDDPYADRETDSTLKPVVHVQEVQMVEAGNQEKIKEMVYKYGGVQSSIYMSLQNSTSTSKHYNNENSSYCYIGENKPNHDVVIIGWDDNYPKENFNANIEKNGAFICQNSWGEEFGDNGIIYISYCDSNIGMTNVVYTGVEKTDNYDNIYQSDLCGFRGMLGYDKEYAFFSNVYTAKKDEYLAAASFYATDKNTKYTIYVCEDFKDTGSLTNKKAVATGTLENAGYYTVDFDRIIELSEGQRFAIIVSINTPNCKKPVAVEMAKDFASINVDLSDGEGYISLDGVKWENTEENQNCNICLKGFTIDRTIED